MDVWTIGHSTRPFDQFQEILAAHGIRQLVDVRTIPRSQHNPQYNTVTLAQNLNKAGVAYLHMPQLGGLRKAKKDSINKGWRNTSFRGYADYMQEDEFWIALDELMALATSKPTAIMCAEAVPWRCHRSLIADAFVSRGWRALDIMTAKQAAPHTLTAFAQIGNGRVSYPPPSDTPRLFE